jgi:basic membrane protein A and related proteins
VEVAHEALLTEWGRLAGWIDRHREDLRRHQALTAVVEQWESSGRHPDYLLAGSRLREYEAWSRTSTMQLTASEREFLHAGLERQRAEQTAEAVRRASQQRLERRARTRLLALVVAVVLLAGAVSYGTLAWRANRTPDAVLLSDRGLPAIGGMVASGFDGAVSDLGIRGEEATSAGTALQPEDARRVSRKAAGIIFVIATEACDVIGPVARDYPRTRYVTFDCQGDQPNVAYVSFAAEQGSFLAGAAAALKSRTGIIGFVGGVDIPLIWAFKAGYEAGARAVNPAVQVRATYLSKLPDVTGFSDEIGAFEAAEQMYRGGADIVYQAAGAAGDGVFEAAYRVSDQLGRHLWAIGVDSDQYLSLSLDDPWRPHILTSVVKRYDRAVHALLTEYSGGRFTPGPRQFDLANDGLELADSGGFIADLRPHLERLRRRIVAGEIRVPIIPADRMDQAKGLGLA